MTDEKTPSDPLAEAVEAGARAGRRGFDWPDATGPRAKVNEELAELDEAIAGGRAEDVASELGDVLFAVANLARHLHVSPGPALEATRRRFQRRLEVVESTLEAEGRSLKGASPAELEARWQAAKRALAGEE